MDDKKITDHYAIIPTGQGLQNLNGLSPVERNVYELICRRFLAIFFPPALYEKAQIVVTSKKEKFFKNFKFLKQEGYLKVWGAQKDEKPKDKKEGDSQEEEEDDQSAGVLLETLKKGDILSIGGFEIKEGTTSAPKRYTSGSLILAMENAGQLIEDEELRA